MHALNAPTQTFDSWVRHGVEKAEAALEAFGAGAMTQLQVDAAVEYIQQVVLPGMDRAAYAEGKDRLLVQAEGASPLKEAIGALPGYEDSSIIAEWLLHALQRRVDRNKLEEALKGELDAADGLAVVIAGLADGRHQPGLKIALTTLQRTFELIERRASQLKIDEEIVEARLEKAMNAYNDGCSIAGIEPVSRGWAL